VSTINTQRSGEGVEDEVASKLENLMQSSQVKGKTRAAPGRGRRFARNHARGSRHAVCDLMMALPDLGRSLS
jgi:hypothetical protein